MAVEKPRATLVSSLGFLFYLSTMCGIMPYSPRAFYKHTIFKWSLVGNVWVAVSALHSVIQYHFASQAFSVGDKNETGMTLKF